MGGCLMGTIFKNKTKVDRNFILKEFVSGIKNGGNEQFASFVDTLAESGFLNSVTSAEMKDTILEKDFQYLPLMRIDKIMVGITICDNVNTIVGIDPAKYFNKISQCAILVHFPMSKNDYKIFENVFKKILEEKSSIRKQFLDGNFNYSINCRLT